MVALVAYGALRGAAMAASLQLGRTGAVGHSMFLLVSIPVGDPHICPHHLGPQQDGLGKRIRANDFAREAVQMNWTAIIVFIALFGLVTVLGFLAAYWRRGHLDQLNEWGWRAVGLAPSSLGFSWVATSTPPIPSSPCRPSCSGPGRSASSRCLTPSLSIRWSFSYCRACGRSRTSTITSLPAISCRAATATAGSRWQSRSPASLRPCLISRCSS